MEDNIDAIHKWYWDNIQRVNKHANEQLEILQRDYNIQQERLDHHRRLFRNCENSSSGDESRSVR